MDRSSCPVMSSPCSPRVGTYNMQRTVASPPPPPTPFARAVPPEVEDDEEADVLPLALAVAGLRVGVEGNPIGLLVEGTYSAVYLKHLSILNAGAFGEVCITSSHNETSESAAVIRRPSSNEMISTTGPRSIQLRPVLWSAPPGLLPAE